MCVTLSNFCGIIPRYSRHNLGALNAEIAHDVKLRNGRLEAWREKCVFENSQTNSALKTAGTFHIYGCCPVYWPSPSVVSVAEFAPDWGRFYVTGRSADAEVAVVNRKCQAVYQLLGVPAPTTPPVATAAEECDRRTDARAYYYTYVNQWGEESAPSPASNIVVVRDGVSVQVSGIALPPEGYGIIAANLYRAATGFRQDDVKTQKPLTDFLYVTTIEFPTTSFTDTVKMIGLGPVCETQKVRMPPKGLQNIVAIGGVNRLAGTVKNRVHLSENHQPYNWPVKYDLTLDHTIIHMGALDQRLYVTTDAVPYVIDVSSCEDAKCTPVIDVDTPLPDISCGHSSSAVMTPHGYVYVSPLGVTLIDSSAKWHILTKKWFSEDDWALIRPETVRMAYWEGFLFIVSDTVTFLLDINGDPYGDMKGAELTTLSDTPIDLKTSSNGTLFMLEDQTLYVWNSGDELRPYQWLSRELTGEHHQPGMAAATPQSGAALGNLWTPTSAKVRTKETEFTLVSSVSTEVYRRMVVGERPFRLPRAGRHPWWRVQFKGIEPVEFAVLGTSFFTVNAGE